MKQAVLVLTVTCAFGLYAGQAMAGKIHDPTKPKRDVVIQQNGQLTDGIAEAVEVEVSQPAAVPEFAEGLKLQSIMRSKKGRIAIISGEVLNQGDSFREYTIGEIHKDYVVILGSGQQKRLYIYE